MTHLTIFKEPICWNFSVAIASFFVRKPSKIFKDFQNTKMAPSHVVTRSKKYANCSLLRNGKQYGRRTSLGHVGNAPFVPTGVPQVPPLGGATTAAPAMPVCDGPMDITTPWAVLEELDDFDPKWDEWFENVGSLMRKMGCHRGHRPNAPTAVA